MLKSLLVLVIFIGVLVAEELDPYKGFFIKNFITITNSGRVIHAMEVKDLKSGHVSVVLQKM